MSKYGILYIGGKNDKKKKKKENKSRETNTSFKYHRHSGISSIISIKRRKKSSYR